jgi:hypothetical protein
MLIFLSSLTIYQLTVFNTENEITVHLRFLDLRSEIESLQYRLLHLALHDRESHDLVQSYSAETAGIGRKNKADIYILCN